MTLPKVKFSWRTSAITGGIWRGGLFCFYDARAASAGRLRAWTLAVSLRGLLLWLMALAVVAYFSGAGVLWAWLHRRPYNRVTYADLVLPANWPQLQHKRGQAQIDAGLADFKNHKWREGEMKLRVGINRAPDNPAARIELARFYVAINQRNQAKAVLTAGLENGYPGSDYLRQIYALAADAEDYDWWIRTCDTVLAQLAASPDRPVERLEVLRQKMSALMAEDRPEEVIKLVDSQGDKGGPLVDEFKVLALIKAGRPTDAVALLDAWRKRSGPGPQVVRLQVRAFREAGRLADMEHALEELRAYSPAVPQPYIYGIIQQSLAGRWLKIEVGVDDFLMRFGSDPQTLFALAEPLVEIGDQHVLERLVAHARQQGFNPEPFQNARLKVFMNKGDWSQARALLAELRAKSKTASAEKEFWYELVERLCNAAVDPGEGAQGSLTDFVREKRLPLKMDKELIVSLRRAGRPAAARVLITFAQGNYPENETLKTWRDELDKELAVVVAPPPEVVLPKVVVPAAPVSVEPAPVREAVREGAFFERLAAAEKKGDFAGALAQIQEMRASRPGWLIAREEAVEIEEIRLNGRAGNLPALHLAASLYINGDGKRSLKAAGLARELYEAGCKEAAIMLAKDLLRKVPNYPPAKRMLAEWEPKPAVAQP
ncbi:MAG: hypothetical protein WC661_06125 [Opitutaceae bacterium]|jgi:hypothetical protein